MFRVWTVVVLSVFYNPFVSFCQNKAIIIQNQRELFVDDYLIDKLTNMENRLGVPVSGGVALKLDKPWEGQFGLAGSIIKVGNLYRMYYRGWPELDLKANANPNGCYAESVDGITWTRPKLRNKEVNGTLDNNVIKSNDAFSTLYDNREGVPAEEKYKALTGGAATGLHVIVSKDGFNWRPFTKDTPVTGVAIGHMLDSPNILAWVPSENVYAIYMRGWTNVGLRPEITTANTTLKFGAYNPNYNYGIRTLMRSTSKDLIHWTEPEMMKFGNTPMEHLYTNATQPYFRAPQILISMPMRFNPDSIVLSKAEFDKYGIHSSMRRGVSDAVFMTSRGGNVYDRKFMQSFIRPGLSQKNWAARSQIPALGVVPTGTDEISFYVTRGYGTNDAYVERLKLRTDGFASLNAVYSEGSAITKPLILRGDTFLINYSSSPIGYVKVVLLNANGEELPGFGEKDAIPVKGDKIDTEVTWKEGRSIGELSGKNIRIKFIAKDADIYSFGVFDRQ